MKASGWLKGQVSFSRPCFILMSFGQTNIHTHTIESRCVPFQTCPCYCSLKDAYFSTYSLFLKNPECSRQRSINETHWEMSIVGTLNVCTDPRRKERGIRLKKSFAEAGCSWHALLRTCSVCYHFHTHTHRLCVIICAYSSLSTNQIHHGFKFTHCNVGQSSETF